MILPKTNLLLQTRRRYLYLPSQQSKLGRFQSAVNNIHLNRKFIKRREENNTLSFLDVFLIRKQQKHNSIARPSGSQQTPTDIYMRHLTTVQSSSTEYWQASRMKTKNQTDSGTPAGRCHQEAANSSTHIPNSKTRKQHI